MPVKITEAFLLCGGSSERLGFAKEMLRVDGVPLAAAMVAKLRRLFGMVAVVSNQPAYLEHWLDVPIHADIVPGLGPLAGIHAGLKQSKIGRAFFLGCDMPLVPDDVIRRVAATAEGSAAAAVVARTRRGPEPLCAVYDVAILPTVEARIRSANRLSVTELLQEVEADFVDLARQQEPAFRDIDRPADLSLLREVFAEVEPLPVRRLEVTRVGGQALDSDIVAEERPVALRVNGVHLVTILCLPVALRELAAGFLAYLGLIDNYAAINHMDVDYERGRVSTELDLDESALRKAIRLQISSTCGAGVYGPPLHVLAGAAGNTGFRVGSRHILEVMRKLRKMSPVFERTGATHQAAFSDGRRVAHFYEDVGRHNAIDKVVGRCLTEGTDTGRGVLMATGRLNAEMVVKALRQGIPVAATRSAVTGQAIALALKHGLTLVGFARGGRLNIYTCPERILTG